MNKTYDEERKKLKDINFGWAKALRPGGGHFLPALSNTGGGKFLKLSTLHSSESWLVCDSVLAKLWSDVSRPKGGS